MLIFSHQRIIEPTSNEVCFLVGEDALYQLRPLPCNLYGSPTVATRLGRKFDPKGFWAPPLAFKELVEGATKQNLQIVKFNVQNTHMIGEMFAAFYENRPIGRDPAVHFDSSLAIYLVNNFCIYRLVTLPFDANDAIVVFCMCRSCGTFKNWADGGEPQVIINQFLSYPDHHVVCFEEDEVDKVSKMFSNFSNNVDVGAICRN